MEERKMSFWSGSLLWFGAAISIAEILTGTLITPLGFRKGLLAILLGHLIGGILFYAAGLIGAKNKVSAMESVRFSFGRYGSVFFSVLNVLQLVGWTAVMIISGAEALGSVANGYFGRFGNAVWCVVIGALVVLWIVAGLKNLSKLNNIAVLALFVLCAVLGVVVFRQGSVHAVSGSITFCMALELAIAMPISWLPLVSDYTKNTDKPVAFTAVSSVCYFFGSCFMYTIGLGAAVFTGSSDIVQILQAAKLGIAAVLIVVLATVTTTFLDVYSAGESMRNIVPKWNGKIIGIAVSVIGTVIALFSPIERYQDFLYLIGSVFVPMAAILITDAFILRKPATGKKVSILNSVLWGIGFILYRFFLKRDTVLGSTVPVVLIVIILCIAANTILKKVEKKHA